ncbi:hypothetical protein V2H77_15495 [Photorhabdus sp. P32]|uniref:hypothetical protein n=1 Tax=Photorhabdus sp. P32 TaxID=3117549 RepID=UPI00311AC2E9
MAVSMTKEKKSDGWNNEKFDRVFAGSSSTTNTINNEKISEVTFSKINDKAS